MKKIMKWYHSSKDSPMKRITFMYANDFLGEDGELLFKFKKGDEDRFMLTESMSTYLNNGAQKKSNELLKKWFKKHKRPRFTIEEMLVLDKYTTDSSQFIWDLYEQDDTDNDIYIIFQSIVSLWTPIPKNTILYQGIGWMEKYPYENLSMGVESFCKKPLSTTWSLSVAIGFSDPGHGDEPDVFPIIKFVIKTSTLKALPFFRQMERDFMGWKEQEVIVQPHTHWKVVHSERMTLTRQKHERDSFVTKMIHTFKIEMITIELS